jgi:hypothetical protein
MATKGCSCCVYLQLKMVSPARRNTRSTRRKRRRRRTKGRRKRRRKRGIRSERQLQEMSPRGEVLTLMR